MNFISIILNNPRRNYRVEVIYENGDKVEANARTYKDSFYKTETLHFITFDNGTTIHPKDFDGNDLFKDKGIIGIVRGTKIFYANGLKIEDEKNPTEKAKIYTSI